MTERTWLKGTDGVELAEYWGDRFTERKARLLMLACCRRQARHFKHKRLDEAVKRIADHYADPTAPVTPFDGRDLCTLYHGVDRVASGRTRDPGRGVAFGVLAAVEPVTIANELEESFRYLVYSCLRDVESGVTDTGTTGEAEAQAVLVREILGNPFRRVKLKPAWLTDTVLTLARQIYAADEFSAMPILADALQDAGCDNDAILNHCRHEPLHVRGCWLLDLILKKE